MTYTYIKKQVEQQYSAIGTVLKYDLIKLLGWQSNPTYNILSCIVLCRSSVQRPYNRKSHLFIHKILCCTVVL